jgi:ParB family chromosome partitioning protein
VRRGGLGRGLSALIPGANDGARRSDLPGSRPSSRPVLIDVPVHQVRTNPRQPRTSFPQESLIALAASISQVGLLQPIVVRQAGDDDGFVLVAGERRLRAARLAGRATVPAIVRADPSGDGLQEALIENIHREDLSPLELAAAFQELLEDVGATQEDVAARLGCSRAHVANTIRLLSLPPDVQRLLGEGRIQAGHARALLAVADDDGRSALALRIAAEGLSVRQVEDLVRRYTAPRPARGRADPVAAGTGEIEERLMERLGTRVRVVMGKRRGRIVVEVSSPEELDRIATAMGGPDVVLVPEPDDLADRRAASIPGRSVLGL